MSKLTPMILALLMLASTSLVAMDWAELEENDTMEADGRTGPDADVVSILSPRETTTDDITGEQRNTLKSGDDVHFEAFISNAGDVAIAEMGVSVTVYLDEGGARGNVALDASGNELSWTNGDVVCDDTFVCPWSTLEAGANLDSGKYTLMYQGSPVTWTPTTGDYWVVVEAMAEGDNDPGNDYEEIRVSVVEWTDVVLDLAWDSGKETEGGSGDKSFTLTVSTDGSTEWSARDITVALVVSGTLTEALDTAGNDLMGTTQHSAFGTQGVVETFRHETEANNTTTASRYEMSLGDSDILQGHVTPDTSGDSGDYSIEVSLVSYTIYGQLPDCMEETTRTDPNGTGEETPMTYSHFCEVVQSQDDVASTSEDMIEGTVQTFHDIGVTNLMINQGYAVDEDNNPMGTPTMPGITEGPLNPAWGSVQATVRHMGSDLGTTYDWKVTFNVENTVTGVTHTEDADSCTGGSGEDYVHMRLGDDPMAGAGMEAMEMGQACIMYEFTPGVYDITAVISMVGETVTDMSSSNDDSDMLGVVALNNRPTVSVTLETEGDIILGPDALITLVADAVDADDDAGLSLVYTWTHPDIPEGARSVCDGIGPAFSTCNLMPLTATWASVNTYSVRVEDAYGSYSQDTTEVFVWNYNIASSTTASGIEMLYDLTYNGYNEFTITATDSDASYTQDLTEFGYAGEYSSVAVVDYVPSSTYMGDDVLSQSITMNYDASALEPTSVFYINNNGLWAKLDATISSAGSDGTISIAMDSDAPVLAQGEIALMGGELQIIEPPAASPTGLSVVASAGGTITAAWDISGNTVPGDWIEIMITCDGAECENDLSKPRANASLRVDSLDGQTETTHGMAYTYTLSVCNTGGCNPTIATATAIADNAVDGDVHAEDMSVSNKDADTWTVTWSSHGDTSDVAGWSVCYGDSAWDVAGAMPRNLCTDVQGADAGSADIAKPGGTTKMYHFTAVPFDALGNSKNDVSLTDITLIVEDDGSGDACDDDPTLEGCGDTIGTETEGEVPAWTWGLIIGLVVVAFVAGAFILSRGGDEDEGKDWDY